MKYEIRIKMQTRVIDWYRDGAPATTTAVFPGNNDLGTPLAVQARRPQHFRNCRFSARPHNIYNYETPINHSVHRLPSRGRLA